MAKPAEERQVTLAPDDYAMGDVNSIGGCKPNDHSRAFFELTADDRLLRPDEGAHFVLP